ncbi:hypothetical protein FHS45_002746 [Thalassobacillus devorans]|nr:hypothetical protein [Thalassobacillus devorans]
MMASKNRAVKKAVLFLHVIPYMAIAFLYGIDYNFLLARYDVDIHVKRL